MSLHLKLVPLLLASALSIAVAAPNEVLPPDLPPVEIVDYSIAKVTHCVQDASLPTRCQWISKVDASAFVRGWRSDARPVATAWFLQDDRVIPVAADALMIFHGPTGLMVRVSQDSSTIPLGFTRPGSSYVGKPVRLRLRIGDGPMATEVTSDAVVPAIAS